MSRYSSYSYNKFHLKNFASHCHILGPTGVGKLKLIGKMIKEELGEELTEEEEQELDKYIREISEDIMNEDDGEERPK